MFGICRFASRPRISNPFAGASIPGVGAFPNRILASDYTELKVCPVNTTSIQQTNALPPTRAQFGRDVPTIRRQFASDNYAGICPEAWLAMEEANQGHERSYGDDRWTQQASDLIREVFETHCDVFFVFNQ